jgi:hypothetical protein
MPLVPKRWKLHCYLSDVWGGLHGVLPFYGIFDWKRGNCIAITIFVCACLPVSVRVFFGFLYLHVPVCMSWRQAQIINKDLPYLFVCLHFEFLLIWGPLFVLVLCGLCGVRFFSRVAVPCLVLSSGHGESLALSCLALLEGWEGKRSDAVWTHTPSPDQAQMRKLAKKEAEGL